jgi:hypothetical protein
MAQRPDFFAPASIESAAGDNSESQFYNSLADRMARFSAGQFRRAERQASISGEKAGVAAAQGGDLNLRPGSGVKSQAYNRGALRVYTAQTTIDILKSMPELEAQAYQKRDDGLTYGERFDAVVKGYRDGLLKNMPADVAPEMTELMDRQILGARERVLGKQLQEQQEFDRAVTEQSLTDLADLTSQAVINGDDELAEQSGALFESQLMGAVQDGVYTPEQALKATNSYQARITESSVFHQFDSAYDSGRGVQFITEFSKTVPAGMSAEQHTQVWGRLETRLARKTKHIENGLATDAAARKERHRMGKTQAVLAMMNGEEVDLVSMVEGDLVDADWALSHEQRSRQQGPAFDDEATAAVYETSLLDWDDQDILNDEDLTYPTRVDLVNKRNALLEDAENWQGSKQGKEGTRRIRDAVGIPQGVLIQSMSNKAKLEASQALSSYYAQVEALPVEQRATKAIEIADKIVANTSAARAGESLRKTQDRLEATTIDRDSYEADSAQWKLKDQAVKTLERKIKDLEASLQ